MEREFDPEKRRAKLARLRSELVVADSELTAEERFRGADELLEASISLHGVPVQEDPWPLLVQRRNERR